MSFEGFIKELWHDPFLDLKDGELSEQIARASGICAAALSGIMDGISGGGLDALGQIDSSVLVDQDKLTINTFPFGKKTNEIHPDYIGICCGAKTTFKKLMGNVEKHCWLAERNLEPRQEKTVLVLTDKWDTVRFRSDYEKLFMYYAMRDNVLFMFILLTDYGVSTIPFLPWDWRELARLRIVYDGMGGFDEDMALERLLKCVYCKFEVHTRSKEGESCTVYHFDFERRTYGVETTMFPYNRELAKGQDRRLKSGNLTAQKILDFASAVFYLSNLPDEWHQENPITKTEDTVHVLHLFDKEFVWVPGQDEFEKIRDAVENLIKSK